MRHDWRQYKGSAMCFSLPVKVGDYYIHSFVRACNETLCSPLQASLAEIAASPIADSQSRVTHLLGVTFCHGMSR